MKRKIGVVLLSVLLAMSMIAGCGKKPGKPAGGDETSWSVRFETNGGSAVASLTVNDGETITAPASPTKADSAFDAWCKDAELTKVWTFASDIVLKDTVLYARWTDLRPLATFDSAGGTAVDAVRFSGGGKIAKPADPKRNGYTFDGWKTTEGTLWNFETMTANEAITLIGSWSVSGSLRVTSETRLDLGAGEYTGVNWDGEFLDGMDAVANLSDISMTLKAVVAQPGDYGLYMASAKEWNNAKLAVYKVEANGALIQDRLRSAPTGSWSETMNSNLVRVPLTAGENTIRITVDTEATLDKLDAVEKIKAIVLTDCVPSYDYMPTGGMTLDKTQMTTQAELVENAYRATTTAHTFRFSVSVSETANYDLSLFASRPVAAGVAELEIDVDGTDILDAVRVTRLGTQQSRENTFFLQPAALIPLTEGAHTLTLSFREGSAVSAVNYLDIMYLRMAKSANQAEKVLVEFDSDGGSAVSARRVAEGAILARPADPIKDGEVFEGWFTAAGEKWNFADPVTRAMTLSARYLADVTVTVDFVGEPGVEGVELRAGETLDPGELVYTARPGYTVVFYIDAEKSARFDFTQPVESDTTVYTFYEEVALPEYAATKLDLSQGEYSAVSWDGEKIDWGNPNGSVTLAIQADEAGERGFYLEYGRDVSFSPYFTAEYRVSVNGVAASETLRVVPTAGWGDACMTNVIALNLQAGANALKLEPVDNSETARYLAHIRGAYLMDGMPTYSVFPRNLQAAAQTLSGCSSQYGGKFVDFQSEGAYVEFNMTVAAAGNFDILLMYASQMSATATVSVYVNGGADPAATISAAAGNNRDSYGLTDSVRISLSAGVNTIRLTLGAGVAQGESFDLSAVRIANAV